MGYRPDDQALEEPIEKMLEGIDEYIKAVNKRIDSGEWRHDHIIEINDISLDLQRLRPRLNKIKEDTW